MRNLLGIVYLNGEMRVGKDETFNKLKDRFCKKINVQRHSIAHPIKVILARMEGITLEELERRKPEFRDKMISLGEEIKKIDPFFFVNKIAKLNLKPNTLLIITDGRYDCEPIWIREIWNEAPMLSVKIHKDHWKKYRSSPCGYNLLESFVDYNYVNDFDNGSRWEKNMVDLVDKINEEFSLCD